MECVLLSLRTCAAYFRTADVEEHLLLTADDGGEIKVHTIYKPATKGKKSKVAPPKWIRGYGYVSNDKVAPLRIVAGGRPGRFLLFLDGDLLYSTYNNRFPIREGKNGALEVGIGFNGGGAPWKPLKGMVKLIQGQKKSR